MAEGSLVMLYVEGEAGAGENDRVSVPDVTGMSVVAANRLLRSCGLQMRVEGSGVAVSQSPAAHTARHADHDRHGGFCAAITLQGVLQMKLNALAGAVPGEVMITGNAATEIASLCTDSRKVTPGALFFCIPGLHTDAHDLAPEALSKGAAALVVERELPLGCPQVKVKSVRRALSYMAQEFFGNPARRMKLIGITGTKGKTTSSFLIKSVLEAAGHKVGMIGTVLLDDRRGGHPLAPDHARPHRGADALKGHGRRGRGICGHGSIGARAGHAPPQRHALCRGGVYELFQDHLDYFGDMDNYFAAKMRLLQPDMSDAIVYNCDDEHVAAGIKALGREALRTGIRESSDVYANDIEVGERGLTFLLTFHKRFRVMVDLQLAGIFNVYNALLAAGVAIVLGIGPEAIRTGLEDVRAVPGRIELLETETPYRVILDYAHSPDSLENILKSVRQTTKGRLIALFGCGGDRDHGKRPIMGEIAGELGRPGHPHQRQPPQ